MKYKGGPYNSKTFYNEDDKAKELVDDIRRQHYEAELTKEGTRYGQSVVTVEWWGPKELGYKDVWGKKPMNIEEEVGQEITGNEEFEVKDYELVYTGGGITVAYGVYTNGLGFSIGSDLLFLYDEDARNQFEEEDDVEWQETHSLFDDYGMGLTEKTNLFQTTLKQVFDEEVAKNSNVEPWRVMNYSDVFRENNDILNVSVGESVRKNMGRKLKENQFNDYDFEEVEYKENTPKCRTISRFLSRIDVYDLGYQLVREADGIVEVEFPDVELTDDDIEKIKRNAIDILGINVEVERDGDFCTLYFDFAKKESLKNMRRKLAEELVEPFPEDIEFFEKYITDTLGYEIEAKGKTWFMHRDHYQIRSPFNNNTMDDLRDFARELNKLDELMDKREIPMTYSAGLTDDGYITAGLDLNKKWIPDNEDSVKPQPTKIKVRDFDLLDDDDELVDIDEARYSDAVPYEKRRYWYWTKHGLGPGTLPKGVNVLDAKDGQNQKGTWGVFVLLDAVLNTDELKQYDLIELAPQEERKPVKANIWSQDGETTGYVVESRQLNEGPGAGYTVKGTIKNVSVNNVDITSEESDYGITYVATGDITADLEDVSCDSYYYGGAISSTPIKIERVVFTEDKSYELESKPEERDIYDLLESTKIETTVGGGWSHTTFDGELECTEYNIDWSPYATAYTPDIIEIKFTDPKAVDAIDKYATGEAYDTEYSVLDENEDEIEYFDTEEGAIKYAKENSYPYVAETHWGWEYAGNGDYNTTDRFDSSEIIWTNEDVEV